MAILNPEIAIMWDVTQKNKENIVFNHFGLALNKTLGHCQTRRRPVRKPGVFGSYAILLRKNQRIRIDTQEGAWQHKENIDESRSRECVGGYALERMLNNGYKHLSVILKSTLNSMSFPKGDKCANGIRQSPSHQGRDCPSGKSGS
jgi:hypothetical protein